MEDEDLPRLPGAGGEEPLDGESRDGEGGTGALRLADLVEERGPARIAAGIALEAALPASVRAAIAAGEPLCLVIATPGGGWCQAVAQEIRRIPHAPDAPPGSSERYFVLREKRERAPAEEPLRLADRLARGQTVIGVSPSPQTLLPPILLRSADHRIALPPLSGAMLRRLIGEIAGDDPGPLSDSLGGGLDLADLTAALRKGSQAAGCVERLERAGEARARSRAVAAPLLEQLAGYGAAREWGLSLVREIDRYRSGAIRLEDLPRGLLISGRPGVGKTLLVQAIARSAKLPLIATSAARWLAPGHLGDCISAANADFEEAQRAAPAILFVDEIDSLVDPTRDTSSKSWFMAFRAAILANIDGASTQPGIILVGACNHVDLVDEALRRSGRLDRHVEIPLPDAAALQEIIRLHLGEDLPDADLSGLAQIAVGSTGADVARIVREARALARDAERGLSFHDLAARIAPPDPRTENLRRRIAMHEAAHAVIASRLGLTVEHASLVQQDGAGGYVRIARPAILSRKALERDVMMRLAGRAADLAFGEGPCAGSAADLAAATQMLVEAHARFGLGASLLATAGEHSPAQLLALDPALRAAVEAELDGLWRRTLALVRAQETAIRRLAAALLERRVLSGAEIRRVLASLLARDGAPRASSRPEADSESAPPPPRRRR